MYTRFTAYVKFGCICPFLFLFIWWYCLFRFKLYLHPYICVCTKLVASHVLKFIFILLSFTLLCVWRSSCVLLRYEHIVSFIFCCFLGTFGRETLLCFTICLSCTLSPPACFAVKDWPHCKQERLFCQILGLGLFWFPHLLFGPAFASVLTLSYHRPPSEAWKQLSKCTALSEAKTQYCLPFRFQCSHIVCRKEQEGYVLKVCPIFKPTNGFPLFRWVCFCMRLF